jgi:hypothetical protein
VNELDDAKIAWQEDGHFKRTARQVAQLKITTAAAPVIVDFRRAIGSKNG